MTQKKPFEIPNLIAWLNNVRQQNLYWFDTFKQRKNAYFDFIHSCRTKEYPSETRMHLHHIIPKFMLNVTQEEKNYCDTAENVILLSVDDHRTAHSLFADLYEDPRATGAILLLAGELEQSRAEWQKAGAYASHLVQQLNETGFWDKKAQRERAFRSLDKADARETRSRGGKIAGAKRWKDVAIQKDKRYVFSHEGKELLCILNCETGGDVVRELDRCIPNTGIQRVTPLLNGSRKTASGWSCQKIENDEQTEQPLENVQQAEQTLENVQQPLANVQQAEQTIENDQQTE